MIDMTDTLNVFLAATDEFLVVFEMILLVAHLIVVDVWFLENARQEHCQQQHLSTATANDSLHHNYWLLASSAVVLESWSWSRGASRPLLAVLDLVLVLGVVAEVFLLKALEGVLHQYQKLNLTLLVFVERSTLTYSLSEEGFGYNFWQSWSWSCGFWFWSWS